MQYDIEVGGRTRRVVVQRVQPSGTTFAVTIDGREWIVDTRRIDGASLSLLVEGRDRSGGGGACASHDVTVAADPSGQLIVNVGQVPVPLVLNGARRTRRGAGGGDGASTGTGPQRIVAPMPGKIVRVLVKAGDQVRARQSLVVVEAMKMENELRAARDGVVSEVVVREGQSVEAGVLLAVVAGHREPSRT